MKWQQRDEYYWARECGRYFVARSKSFVEDAAGRWLYLAWFKRSADEVAECISPKARRSLQGAIGDCAAHLQPSQQQPRQNAA
jgi:hypothetical protein